MQFICIPGADITLENKMKKICLSIVFGFISVCAAYAEDATGVDPASPSLHIKHKKGVDPAEIEKHIQYDVTVNTKYGVVQYNKHGLTMIAVNGELVYDNSDINLMENIGDFKLSNEEVLLFEGNNLGNPEMTGIFGETFFLILKANHPPTIVQAGINPVENPVKKAWQKNDEIYVDYRVADNDQTKSPLKLLSDEVVFTKATPILHNRK
jgi:hypothetical protein